MTKQTVKNQAATLGHDLGRFETGKDSRGNPFNYSVAWCRKCGDAAFSGTPTSDVNPALQNKCQGYGANEFARRR
jgi:hypothetical protein